jgi:phosphoglycerate dehydrogenase-like enzyme
MPHVLVDTQIDPSLITELERVTGLTAAVAPGPLDTKRELPEALLCDVRATLCTFLPTNHSVMTSLKLVQLCSAGFNQVENLGLAGRGVSVCNASGVNDVPIAEWVVTMMVALARDLPAMFRNQQQGIWDRGARYQTEIRGRTVGIWGYGGIGRETARLATAMGLRVHVLTRSGNLASPPRFRVEGTGDDAGTLPQRVFSAGQVMEFCESLDFLVLAMPQTPQNVGIVGRKVFEALPARAFLLNPARGPLVNEEDLLWALRSGKIAGAALDTHFKYPMPPDHPLWRMENVIMTPHISGSSKSPRFASRLWQLFGENIRRWQVGGELLNELSKAQLEPASMR